MKTKVVSFDTDYNSACFVTNHGDVRFVGDSGKYGQFGYWSKGTGTVSVVDQSGVNVHSIGDNSYRPPPKNIGKIVKCIMHYGMTLAINESNELLVWGTVKKKLWDSLPHNEAIKDIFVFGEQIAFITTKDVPCIITLRGCGSALFGTITDALLAHKKPTNVMASWGGGYARFEDGTTVIAHDANEDPDNKEIRSFKCNTEWVASDWEFLYWKSNGKVHSIERRDNSNAKLNRSDALEKAVKVTSKGDHIAWLTDDNVVHLPLHSWHQRDNHPMEFQLDKPPTDFSSSFILDADGILIPMKSESYGGAHLILAAFPDWADDDDVVMKLIKQSPTNFKFASTRLRKSVEFSKKVAALGPKHLEEVDGMMRRNRELRSYKRLYDMAP
jgi:hypothetical protein